MPLSAETKKWLEELPLGEQAKITLHKELEANENADKKVRESIMFLPDYSKKQNELKAEYDKKAEELQQKISAEFQKAEALRRAAIKYAEDNKAVFEEVAKKAQDSEGKVKSYQAAIQQLVDQGLVDPAFLQAVGTPNTQTNSAPPIPNKDVLTKKELENILAERDRQKEVQLAFALANFASLADKHRQIFNESLDGTALIKEMMEKGETIEQTWARKYNVPSVLKERENAEWRKKIDEARKEERMKTLSEVSVQGTPAPNLESGDPHRKHILSILPKPTGAAGMSESVKAAVEAYTRGDFNK
jgi:hypothetical protein